MVGSFARRGCVVVRFEAACVCKDASSPLSLSLSPKVVPTSPSIESTRCDPCGHETSALDRMKRQHLVGIVSALASMALSDGWTCLRHIYIYRSRSAVGRRCLHGRAVQREPTRAADHPFALLDVDGCQRHIMRCAIWHTKRSSACNDSLTNKCKSANEAWRANPAQGSTGQ